jgi:competence protein ComEC
VCLVWLIIAVPPPLLIAGLAWSIQLMNQIIHVLASVKGLVFEHIPCTLEMTVALYILLFALSYVLTKRKISGVFLLGFAVIGFQLTVLAAVWNLKQEQESIVFHCSRYSALVTREGTKITAYTNLPESKRQPLLNYATAHFGSPILFRKLPQKGVINGQNVCVIDTATVACTSAKNSVILLRNSPKINLDLLIQTCKPQIIIADGSNYKSYIKRWKASCIQAKIPFHATGEKGFYVVN